MSEMGIPDELIDQLLGDYQGPEQLTGPDGLINRLLTSAFGIRLLAFRDGGDLVLIKGGDRPTPPTVQAFETLAKYVIRNA